TRFELGAIEGDFVERAATHYLEQCTAGLAPDENVPACASAVTRSNRHASLRLESEGLGDGGLASERPQHLAEQLRRARDLVDLPLRLDRRRCWEDCSGIRGRHDPVRRRLC